MGRFRQRLMRFMYGRYGFDELSRFLCIFYFVLFVFSLILRIPVVYMAIRLLMTLDILVVLFRMLSKNIYKRRTENAKFIELSRPAKSEFQFLKDRIRDRKITRYRKCPACKAMIRFPIKKGKHTATCPRCSKHFGVWIIM